MNDVHKNSRYIFIPVFILLILAFAFWTFPTNANMGIKFISKTGGISKTFLDTPTAPTEFSILTIDDVTVLEGDAASVDAVFTVSLTPAYFETVSVIYTSVNDTATAPDDFGSVSGTLVFTEGITTRPITVTVQGDSLLEGTENFTISLTPPANATLGDGTGLGTITDNDGVQVSPLNLTTGEDGTADSFSIVLTSDPGPGENVTVDLVNTDPSEGTLSTNELIFNSGNWSSPQDVTVNGVNDDIDDGNISYTIQVTSTSLNPLYNEADPNDVGVTNNDDSDTAGITVNPTTTRLTTEDNDFDQFTVVLDSEPTAPVTVTLSSSDPGEGTVSPPFVEFNNTDWNVPQAVTVTGEDDVQVDGDQNYTIETAPAVSSDPNYTGRDADDVSVINQDNDAPGINIQPVDLTTYEPNVADTFTVTLATPPTSTVTISLSNWDATEGSVSPISLDFDDTNWNIAQTVTVTGVDDEFADGPVDYTIQTAASSLDLAYDVLNPSDVSVTNNDNDTAAIVLDPTIDLETTEGAGSPDLFTVALNSKPTAVVTVTLTSSDITEGLPAPPSLVAFNGTNWNSPQPITVIGVNDDIDDGDVGYDIQASAVTSLDPVYAALPTNSVSVTSIDIDTHGISVDPIAGLVTTEVSGTDLFTVTLDSKPTDVVTVTLTSSDQGEGLPSPNPITFDDTNWYIPQPITVTGVDDFIVDGDQPYTIITTAASDDPDYDGEPVADVSVTNKDDGDTAGINVLADPDLSTTEAGGIAEFDIVLTSEPTAVVTVTLSTTDDTEGIPTPSLVTFAPETWNITQPITVTGQNDFLVDGDISYTITTIAATSNDPNYSGIPVDDVELKNSDDDAAGITITPPGGLITTEAGGDDTFTVVLDSQPTQPVTVTLSSNNTSEGTVSPTLLVFTDQDWGDEQTVTVTGKNDDVDDGDVPYTINTAPAESGDPVFDGLNPPDVSVLNEDDDTAGVTITPRSGLVTTEAGGTAEFTVVLESEPTQDVAIVPSSKDMTEGRVTSLPLEFTSATWDIPQIVTIEGVDDNVVDGSQPYDIQLFASTSDGKYGALDLGTVSATNQDNDTNADLEDPTVTWLSPVDDGGQMNVTLGIIDLEVFPDDNVDIDRVRFYRHDASIPANVEIAVIYGPPYRVSLDTSILNGGWNQINAVAYDTSGNSSNLLPEGDYIWLIRDWYLFMPGVMR